MTRRVATILRLSGFQARALPGLYRVEVGAIEVLVVDVRHLPEVSGTSFLAPLTTAPRSLRRTWARALRSRLEGLS